MDNKFINIGFNNTVNRARVLSVLNPDTLPSKRLISDARNLQKLIDATCGRKTRAIVVLDSGHLVLCGLQCETIVSRLNADIGEVLKPEEEEDESE